MGEGADVGDRKKASRKRAVGTREHIVAYLTGTHELFDPGGMASTRLAAAVGYPGSSVAFAQLLFGMERSGLIERDVRGKRTYRIKLGPAAVAAPVSAGVAAAAPAAADEVDGLAGMHEPGAGPHAGAGTPGFDYDELARRLLAQIVRRLAGAEPAGAGVLLAGPGAAGAGASLAGAGADAVGADAVGADAVGADADSAALRETVADLESKLASAWTKHGKLAEENARLREQLRGAEQSLALARESLRRLPVVAGLDSAEVMLLQRLLAPADWEEARPVGA